VRVAAVDPIDPVDLPANARRHFDDLTPEVIALGFRQIGEHRTRSAPLTLVRRFRCGTESEPPEFPFAEAAYLVDV